MLGNYLHIIPEEIIDAYKTSILEQDVKRGVKIGCLIKVKFLRKGTLFDNEKTRG